jgi:hypothetical protein
MRLSVLHDIAAAGTQLVLDASKQLHSSSSCSGSSSSCSGSSSSSNSSSNSSSSAVSSVLAASGLQDCWELLALTLLVLHGQLTAAGDRYHTAASPASTDDGQTADDAQQQQQQQDASQQFAKLLDSEMTEHHDAVHTFMYPWLDIGSTVAAYWEAAPC